MLMRGPLWLAILGLTVACGPGAMAAEPVHPAPSAAPPLYRRFKVSVGYHYSAGDYGSSETTEIHYVPLVLTGELSRFLLQGTIPYLYISGPPGIIEGPNGPIETDGNAGGLGDLLLRGSYIQPISSLLPDEYAWNPWVPYFEVIGLVKFPTASRSDGLGTGEFDFGIEAEVTWVIGRLTPFLTAGYRFLGSPPDIHLDDVFVGSIGALYRILDPLSAGLLLEYRQSPSPETGQQLDLVPFGAWQFHPPWSVEGYVSAGLADGSPDVGVGLQLCWTW
jgi:hypothetical protein